MNCKRAQAFPWRSAAESASSSSSLSSSARRRVRSDPSMYAASGKADAQSDGGDEGRGKRRVSQLLKDNEVLMGDDEGDGETEEERILAEKEAAFPANFNTASDASAAAAAADMAAEQPS